MDGPRVFVLIPVYEREDVFVSVAVLRRQRQAGMLRMVVVDNGNGNELAGRLQTLADDDCTVIRLERNQGGAGAFRAAMNHALEHGDAGDFVWLLDDDALVNSGTLPGLLNEWSRLSASKVKVGAVGSAMFGRSEPDRLVELGNDISPLGGKVMPRFVGASHSGLGERTDEVDYVAAASLLTTVGVLREVGVFENVFIHYDDIDWSMRLREAGYRIFATSVSYVNHIEPSQKTADWLRYYDTRNRFWCLRRHMPAVYRVALVKRFLRIALHLLQGHVHVAKLMCLGLRHSRTGELLMRDELP